jgi:hypothetical protein
VTPTDRLHPATPIRHLLAFVLALLFGHWLLLNNPGWFSHDELAWAARADVATLAELPWQEWSDLDTFQYRPLTFNLWLLIAHALHDMPLWFHGLWVLLGMAIACLLRQTLRRCGIAPHTASIAALLFALNPYAAYVHGWVATLADLLWLGSGLLLAYWLSGRQAHTARSLHVLLIAATAAVIALLSKEAGVVLAPLAWLAWWQLGRPRHWLWAAIGLTVPTLLYLGLRLDVILYQPRPDGAYAWSLTTVPLNLAAYFLYALLPTTAEVSATLQTSLPRLLVAGGLWLALLVVLARAGWHWLLTFVAGATLALGPVLILETPYNQYAYGASALVVALLALAWSRLGRAGRVLVLVIAALATWHGFNVQRLIHRVGHLQAQFTPSLQVALANTGEGEITLSIDRPGDRWIYARLIDDPLAYGSDQRRVRLVDAAEGSDWRAAYNGRVLATGATSGVDEP